MNINLAFSIPATFGKSTVCVIIRLLRFDGSISYENCSLDIPLNSSEPLTVVSFNHEVVLPIKSPNLQEQRAQIVLQCSAPESSLTELLHLSFFLSALCFLHPIHVSAVPSRTSIRRPSLALTLTLEPMHHHIDPTMHAVEMRINAVPASRPLPEPVSDALIAVCPGSDITNPKIPVCSFRYDTKLDMTTCLEQHIEELKRMNAFKPWFITPVVDHARTPSWNQFSIRLALKPESLQTLTFFLFDKSPGRHDPESVLSDALVGFSTLDLTCLISEKEELQRSFMLDLRLMEAPTASASLEVDCRVWPLERTNVAASAKTPPKTVYFDDDAGQTLVESRALGRSEEVINTPALRNSAAEFQLNHDLSIQLMKEFNLRANALKTAGQEIVDLRRQIHLLTNENNNLKMRIEDEERLTEQIRRNPPKDMPMFDSLSGAELSLQLQTTLQKYRDEKAKSQEMTQRLEAALKEIARGRGLQKHLDNLEKTHLEMAERLQKFQQENQKIDLYRKTAKSQEKVIAKLERVLEGSLDEVNKAQEAKIELEKLKMENARMREKCSSLLTQKRDFEDDTVQELQTKVSRKEEEVKRLHDVLWALQEHTVEGHTVGTVEGHTVDWHTVEGHTVDWHTVEGHNVEGHTEAETSQKLQELEAEKLEWQRKCSAMEQRTQAMEAQLLENAKHYGREISSLKVSIAKRKAEILDLQTRLENSSYAAVAT